MAQNRDGLVAIDAHLTGLSAPERDALGSLLQIGLHRDVEIMDSLAALRPVVSQAFCSALPMAYAGLPTALWQLFALLVLEAAYDATLCTVALNARRGASHTVLLSRRGSGAFGNDDAWIDAALRWALAKVGGADLEVRLVSFSTPWRSMLELQET